MAVAVFTGPEDAAKAPGREAAKAPGTEVAGTRSSLGQVEVQELRDDGGGVARREAAQSVQSTAEPLGVVVEH